jgi:hypothetical protein
VRERAREDDKYVRAIVAQAIAQVEWSRGNYDAALREFELAVKLDALPNQTRAAGYAFFYSRWYAYSRC